MILNLLILNNGIMLKGIIMKSIAYQIDIFTNFRLSECDLKLLKTYSKVISSTFQVKKDGTYLSQKITTPNKINSKKLKF